MTTESKDSISEISAAQRYRSLALYVADFVSIKFNIPFDLTNIEEKKVSYEEFAKEMGNEAFSSQFNCCELPFLSCMTPEIIYQLNNHMLGITEEKKEKKDEEKQEESQMTFGQRFVGKRLNECIAESFKQQVPCDYIKSTEKLSLFRLFFNDDKVLTFQMTCKINEEEVGKFGFCHIENFFELLPERIASKKRKNETSEETNKQNENDKETKEEAK